MGDPHTPALSAEGCLMQASLRGIRFGFGENQTYSGLLVSERSSWELPCFQVLTHSNTSFQHRGAHFQELVFIQRETRCVCVGYRIWKKFCRLSVAPALQVHTVPCCHVCSSLLCPWYGRSWRNKQCCRSGQASWWQKGEGLGDGGGPTTGGAK